MMSAKMTSYALQKNICKGGDLIGNNKGNEKQRERDQVKDTILQKYSIPIIRFSTIGSSENDKLISALHALNPDCGIKL